MSNAFDKASLVMLPHAYEDGKLYSLKPTDRSGDFTFSRGSDTATRVGEDGYIKKETSNLLLQSNQFDTTWALSGITVTSGQSGYDGSSDAWLLSKSAGYARIQQPYVFSGLYAFSLYAKAGTLNWVAIGANASAYSNGCFFDLANGVVGSSGSAVVYKSIESVGNGWYRCIAILNNPTENVCRIYPADGDSDVTGTSGNIYIQDAQINQGLVAQDYLETTTAPVYGGLTDNMPRLDYTDATCPSLLLEPQRTNLITSSEYLTPLNGGVASYNEELSPEGYYNGTSITFGASVNDGAAMGVDSSVTILGNTEYTFSFYAKSISGDGRLSVRIDTNTQAVVYTETVTTTSDWDRYQVTFTTDAGATNFTTNSRLRSSANGNKIAFYGLQLEIGPSGAATSYPTSYIPTYGSSQTRAAEGRNYSGLSSLIGQTEGTLFLDIDSAKRNTEIFSLNRSTQNSIFLITSNDAYRVFIYSDATNLSVITPINISDRVKIAIAYQSNNFAIYANGSQIYTNNSQTWTPNVVMDLLNFNNGGYAQAKGAAKYNQVVLFKERLSNSNLEALTTL